jgi:hypothetical protein
MNDFFNLEHKNNKDKFNLFTQKIKYMLDTITKLFMNL